MQDLRNEKN